MTSARLLPVLAVGVTSALLGAALAPAPAHAAPVPSADDPVTHEENPRVPEGAAWTEHYLPSADGSDTELHADVLRPAHLPEDAETPVILSVGPYFSHAGELVDEGLPATGPSDRFDDLVEGARLMERGYTFVMVDVRGYGGSTGCQDFLGPGEQADVEAAVEWSADQPWSTGRVGMYGKSYDATTGLVGANKELDGLEAVVAQEPLWNMHNHLFSEGVPRYNHLDTVAAYVQNADIQGMADDSERYRENAAWDRAHPECAEGLLSDTQDPDGESPYWRARDHAAAAEGSDVPVIMTQGFIENSTQAEDVETWLENHTGEERGWLGPWEHVRGNDRTEDGRLKMGREGWFEEVMRFYDEHLLDVEPEIEDPAFVIQDSRGTWRQQDTWPEAERSVTVRLDREDYVDDGAGGEPDAYYSWSRPVKHPTRITGTPRLRLEGEGSGNVLVQLYDVAPDGSSVMFDERMSLVEDGSADFDLRSTDWTLGRGHQLVVGIGTGATGSWVSTPSGETISVERARLELDLQNTDDEPTQGARAPWLDVYTAAYARQWDERERGSFPLTVSPTD